MIIGAIFLQNNNQIWLKNVFVSYTQLYDLEFDVWLDPNTTIIHHFKYKFFPQDSVIENGVIIDSGDTYFNGLDMSQLIIGNIIDSSEVSNIYNDNFGGPSGDVLSKLGYSEYINTYSTQIYSIFDDFKNCLLGNSNVTFNFTFMGTSMVLNSSDFITPSGPLKTFVSTFLVFGFVMLIFKQYSHFYHKLQEGDQLGAIETISVDDESILM